MPLPLPDAENARAAMEEWARSPALGELVRLSGTDVPDGLDLAGLLGWLEEFSAAWDFRGGQERNLFKARELDPATDKTITEDAAELGLIRGGVTPRGRYDQVLILGGLARACLARPLAAARVLEGGGVEAGAVTALGGFRELRGDEVGMVEQVAPEQAGGHAVEDEFDAMDVGVRLAFGLDAPDGERGMQAETAFGSWRVHEYTSARQPVAVVAAPSSEPTVRRTNTPDSYAWFATEFAGLQPGRRLLLVTSDLYVPFQHADAVRVLGLPYGVRVETMGIQPGDLDPRLAQSFSADAYLQEVRSTIMAFGRLLAALG
jgi:hypothetical protein